MAKVVYLKEFGSENFGGLLDRFQDHLCETDRGRAAKVYVADVRRFAEWIASKYGSFNPAAITALDLVEYRQYLQNKPGRKGTACPGTVNRALVGLRVFFTWLIKTGQLQTNPAAEVKRVAVTDGLAPKWLERREQAALVHTVQEGGSLRDAAMVGIMLHAGLRISEACALDREDIEISDRKGTVTVRQGKGNKVRVIPLNKTIRKTLSDWLEANPEGPLWPNRYGQPITPRGVFKILAEYAYRAQLEVTPHTLRHTFCKNLIDQGVPIDQVAMLAGHSSLDVTKRYTAPSMADLQSAVDRTAWE